MVECPDCGEEFATPQGVGAHRRHKKCPGIGGGVRAASRPEGFGA